MSNRKKKKKKATTIMNEDRNSRERGRVRNINTEYDRLVVQLGGVVVEPGKDRKRAVAPTDKPSKSKLRKEDILFEAANYMKALMAELEEVKASMAKDVELSGGHLFSDASPPNPPIVTTTTIPESELECDEMFEAIVPADDCDDRVVTTTSSVNAQLLQEEEEAVHAQVSMSATGLDCMQLSNGHHQQHPAEQQQQLTGPSPLHSMFFPFSPEDSPTPLGPNLQNTAEINSPEQVPLPSSTVSALPISDAYTISPELLQLPAHQYFQLWLSSAGSPCDSTSGGGLVAPLSPYLPTAVPGEQASSHCPPVYMYQEL